jgi:hypothetical protein
MNLSLARTRMERKQRKKPKWQRNLARRQQRKLNNQKGVD